MKVSSLVLGAAALAAVTLSPATASAQADPCGGATYSFVNPGLGGSLQGCFSFTLSELGENAGGVGDQWFWTNATGLTGTGAPSNAASMGGATHFGTDDCGSTGVPGSANFRFCDGVDHATLTAGPFFNPLGELVIGMLVNDLPGGLAQNGGVDYWLYSGDLARNTFPTPPGYQAVLYQLTNGGIPMDGEFLFAWEDINSGCTLHPGSTFRNEDLHNAVVLDAVSQCGVGSGGGTPSDDDYNDSYIRLSITGTRQDTVTPEPMTMTLMATGLVGLGGASLRRRNKKS